MGSINWGELDGDLLNLILLKLFGQDRLSFGLVCRHWNALAKTASTFSPCLMYYHRRTNTWKFNQYNAFFDTRFPEIEGAAEIRCSNHGWLLMSRHDDPGALFFFDPNTNQKVELPSVAGEIRTVLCFFNPPTSPECVVVGMSYTPQTSIVDVCTLTRGQGKWKSRKYRIENSFQLSLGPPVLNRGLIYILSLRGDVAILDIKKKRLDAHFNCLPQLETYYPPKAQYLVKVNGEEEEEEEEDVLFGVFVFGDDREMVDVCRLSSDMKWDLVKEEGIGDKVLYVSYTSCFGYKALTKGAENTICFPLFRGDVPVFYSLSDAKYHSIDGDYSKANALRLKNLDFATWVLPKAAREITSKLDWSSGKVATKFVFFMPRTIATVFVTIIFAMLIFII